MAVNLSPVGGAASQFFDNNGVILSGGKIYTYAAGTTTPRTTYTSSSGATAHSNPIILDSAGRVPGGEIWLTDGLIYKFTIETSAGVLLGTYDNISLSLSAASTTFTGFKGQVGNVQDLADNDGSNWIGFLQSGTSAVAISAQDKMRQSVSVKDFGAVGNGATNDAAAFTAALAASPSVYVPPGSYAINTTVTVPTGRVLFGDGVGSIILTSANINTFTVSGDTVTINGLDITHSGNASIVHAPQRESLTVTNNRLVGSGAGAFPLVYTSGSFAAIRFNNFVSVRTFGPCVTLDRTAGVINIESHIEMNRFGGTGYGIRVISSDNSARPEGVYITNNSFICTDENLHIEQVLQCIVSNNVFDQAGNYNVVLKPVNTGIQDIQFSCNYFSTPSQTTTGVCIFHDNTNPAVPLSQVGIVNNTFSFTGFGLVLKKGCVDATVTSNTFTAIGDTGITLNEASKIAVIANTFFAVTTANLVLIDGATGGEFSVDSNQFASNVPVLRTVTNSANFFYGPTNTGRQLAGWSSTSTDNTASPSGSTITIPHGLDGTPPFTRINVSFVADTLVPTAAATAWVDSADATNIYAKVNFAVTTPGSYYVTAYASV